MLSMKNLARRKTRTALTALGVAIGVGSVVALVAVTKGMTGQMDALFTGSGAHLVLTRKGAADPFISYLPDSLVGDLGAHESVEAVHPFLLAATQIPQNPFFFSYGVTEGSPFFENARIVEGAGLFEEGNANHRILLGRESARHLELGVGDRLRLLKEEYEVVGIFESPIAFMSAGGMLSFEDAQIESGLEGKMTSVYVTFERFDEGRAEDYESEIEAAFPVVEASLPSRFTQAFEEFELMDEMVAVFSILAVLIGGVGVMNTMLMSVFERTREIGILQAIGWSKGMILKLVLSEALLVCLIGCPLGVALAIGGVAIIRSIGEFAWLVGDYGVPLIVKAIAVGIGMGVVGAAYPAFRAVRITPIEALRYE